MGIIDASLRFLLLWSQVRRRRRKVHQKLQKSRIELLPRPSIFNNQEMNSWGVWLSSQPLHYRRKICSTNMNHHRHRMKFASMKSKEATARLKIYVNSVGLALLAAVSRDSTSKWWSHFKVVPKGFKEKRLDIDARCQGQGAQGALRTFNHRIEAYAHSPTSSTIYMPRWPRYEVAGSLCRVKRWHIEIWCFKIRT